MNRAGPRVSGATVADAMLRAPKVCGPATTVAHVHEIFRDDHVHTVLIVDGDELLAVVERPDIGSTPHHALARSTGQLHGRVTSPDADLRDVWRDMTDRRRRRLAVIDDHHQLHGLLCLKRTGIGFCSDSDVRERATERARLEPDEDDQGRMCSE